LLKPHEPLGGEVVEQTQPPEAPEQDGVVPEQATQEGPHLVGMSQATQASAKQYEPAAQPNGVPAQTPDVHLSPAVHESPSSHNVVSAAPAQPVATQIPISL